MDHRHGSMVANPGSPAFRWKVLPKVILYYAAAALVAPAIFAGAQVGLEWLHPTRHRTAPPSENGPASPTLTPTQINELIASLRNRVGTGDASLPKEQFAEVIVKLNDLQKRVDGIAAEQTMAKSTESTSVPGRLDYVWTTGMTLPFEPYRDGKTASGAAYLANQVFPSSELSPDTEKRGVDLPHSVIVVLKSGKSVTISSADEDAVMQARQTLSSQRN